MEEVRLATLDDLGALLEVAEATDVVVGVRSSAQGRQLAPSGAALSEVIGLDRAVFTESPDVGAPGEATRVVVPWHGGALRVTVVVVGNGVLGPAEVFAAALSATDPGRSVISLLALDGDGDAAVSAAVEGHAIGLWSYRTHPPVAVNHPLTIIVDGAASVSVGASAMVVAEAVNWVRGLVETPANLLGPVELADEIVRRVESLAPHTRAVVWNEDRLRGEGFGATIGVGAGSARPCLVVELITGELDRHTTALAGKGITFDSGGLDLKRDTSEIAWMKSDMAAAATVAAAVIAADVLGTSRSMHAILPLAENVPSGTALRPGDVITHPDGQTTEVTDTDCEGRLVLADALAWLSATGPQSIIDVGTLTDSGALGPAYWGCWATDQALAESVTSAGAAVGDPGWVLPLHPSYRKTLESRVADIANTALDHPDTGVVAATYLREFVGEIPWVHIDNGSSAWLEHPSEPWPAGATATPVRALIRYLTS